MPVYTLQGPDGRTYTVEGPEGATAEQLGQFVSSQPKSAMPKSSPVVDEMSTYERSMAGAGKAVADTGLGLRQLAGGVMDVVSPRHQTLSSLVTGQRVPSRVEELRKEVQEVRERDAPLMDTRSGMLGNVAGNIAMAVLPGGVVLQGGKLLSKLPAAARMAQSLMTGGKAMMAPTSIPGAAATGAVQGVIQPSTSTQETLTNTGVGGAAGAAIPTLVRGAQVARAALDPFSEAGQKRILGRTLQTAAGSPQDAQALAMRLREGTAPFVGPAPEGVAQRAIMGEIVPGSVPTTGQLAADVTPSIAALERTASATDPTTVNMLARRLAEQNEARRGAVENVAGTGGKRDFFVANRDATADKLYGQARQQGIDPAALTSEAQANMAAFQQRVPDEIMAKARELAKISGVNMDNESSVQGMHWLKKAIDSKINTAKMAGDTDTVRAYAGLQDTLLKGMDELSPAYGEARRTFSAMSKPINEMDVAQAVLDRGSSASSGQLRPEAFARALSDKTAATVTGRPGATLEGVMSPQGLNSLQRVDEDLARSALAQTAGRGPGSDTIQKLAYSNMMQQSGLPAWATALPRAVGVGGMLQRIGDVGYKSANQEMSGKLAQALLNPQDAAALMQAGVVTPQMQRLIEGARRGGAAVGAATPYLLNAGKE